MWETNYRQNILLVYKIMLNNYWIKKRHTAEKTNESYSGQLLITIKLYSAAPCDTLNSNLLIKQCNLKENLELSGTIKVPSHMATWLSPNGSAKKHSLYNKHPSACGENTNNLVKHLYPVTLRVGTARDSVPVPTSYPSFVSVYSIAKPKTPSVRSVCMFSIQTPLHFLPK